MSGSSVFRGYVVWLYVGWSAVISVAIWMTWDPFANLAVTAAQHGGILARALLFLPLEIGREAVPILWVAAMLYSQWAVGGWLARPLALKTAGVRLEQIEQIVLGQAAQGLVVFLLGVVGALNTPLLLSLVAVPAMARLIIHRDIRRVADAIQSFGRTRCGRRAGRGTSTSLGVRLLRLGTRVVIAVFLLVGLLTALHPVWIYDVLAYHFGEPVQWLADGGFALNQLDVLSFVPGHFETLTAVAIAGGGYVGGQLLAFSTLLLLLAWAGAARSGSWRGAQIARLLIATTPVVLLTASQSKPDVGLMLYAAVAVDRSLTAARSLDPRDALLAGVFTGVCAATKYTAVPLVLAPSALLSMALALRTHRGAPVRSILLCLGSWAAAIIVIVAPWLIRNAVWTGNPIYPGMFELFGGPEWSDIQGRLLADSLHQRGLGDLQPSDLWTVLWSTSFSPWQTAVERFGAFGVLGPAFLWLLPGALWRIGDVRETRYTWLVVGVSLVISFTFVWVLRYAAIMLPWFAVLLARGARGTGKTRPAIVATGVVAVLGVAANLTYVLHESLARTADMAVIARGATHTRMLTELGTDHPTELSTFSLMVRLEQLDPGGRIMLVGDTVHSYLRLPHTHSSELNRPAITPYLVPGRAAYQIRDALIADGYSHILFNPAELERVSARLGPLGLTAEQRGQLSALLRPPMTRCVDGRCSGGAAIYALERSTAGRGGAAM